MPHFQFQVTSSSFPDDSTHALGPSTKAYQATHETRPAMFLDSAPVGAVGSHAFGCSADSPPPLSLTASPEQSTVEKKQQQQHRPAAMSHRVALPPPPQCNNCGESDKFLPYLDAATGYGNCEACGNFMSLVSVPQSKSNCPTESAGLTS